MAAAMQNGTAQYVPIVLDRPRRLCFDLNALIALEEATGWDMMRGGVQTASLKLKEVRALLWAGLLHEDPKLKQEDVGKLLHMGNIGEIGDIVMQAYGRSMPEATEAGKAEENQESP